MRQHEAMRDKIVSAIHQARGEGFLDEDEVPPLLAWLNSAHGALTADPTEMPAGPERTQALRQMLIDTMSGVEQTDDCDRMVAALDAFDAKSKEIEATWRRIAEEQRCKVCGKTSPLMSFEGGDPPWICGPCERTRQLGQAPTSPEEP